MAIGIFNRPYGYALGAAVTQSITKFVGPYDQAIVSYPSHGLITGQIVYIKSSVENYNGFWTIEKYDNDYFLLKESTNAERVAWIKDTAADVSFYAFIHGWQCVHLPIIYKISNTKWPTNTEDTVRTISTVTDSSGYCALALSADIKATGSAAALEFVKITGATDADLNGVWQINTYTNDTTFTVEIPYSSANDTALTGASIQYYYNNYHVKVQVWGGLDNGHPYYAVEPYELLATLSLIPDEDGICKFSIHEILKKNVAIKNNLLLGTLPNNLDAFTKFFIKYCEVYDDSDGTTLSTVAESYISDLAEFEGVAVNAKLPFKNVYSGVLSEYISGDSSQKFLTAFTRPTVFSGFYFDLSLLWEGITDLFFKFQWYLNDALQTTTYGDNFDGFYTGVYRGQIEANCDYDRVDVTAYKTFGLPAPSLWTNGSFTAFDTKGATTFVENLGTEVVDAYTTAVIPVGTQIRLTVIVTVTGTWTGSIDVTLYLATSGGAALATDSFTAITANGTYTEEIVITGAGSTSARLYVQLQGAMNSGTADVTITMPNQMKVIDSPYIISETKTIDINCDCLKSKATGYPLSWLNHLGGFDYWYFNEYADHNIDITESGETKENIFPEWPASHGEFADTITKQTHRTSREQVVIRSQHLTLAQLNTVKNIKTSPLVQIVNSIYDRRTVLVDTDSFTYYREGQNELYTLTFTITYTDDVPSQSV